MRGRTGKFNGNTNVLVSSGASGDEGASFKVEKAHLAA